MVTTDAQGKGRRRAALSRELSEFLIDLSIAVHRYAMYPADHPSLRPAVENVIARLTDLLQDRSSLSIGVARRQLLIEGVATEEGHPVLSDLARRMHAQRLGGVRFERGAALDELTEAVQALARDPEREGRPIGLLPESARPSWSHVTLVAAEYDQLERAEEGEGIGETQRLWVELARVALGARELEAGDAPGGRPLARIIEERAQEEAYDEVIVEYLLHLADELSRTEDPQAARVRSEVSGLLESLDGETLGDLLRLGAGAAERRELVRKANRAGIGVSSVVRLLKANAEAEGQSISSSMTRLLGKLAIHADAGGAGRAQAESAIRDHIEGLVADWGLDDPNPAAYTGVLDRMATAVPTFEAAESAVEEDRLSGAERILKMALETGTYGPVVERAALALVDEGEVERVLELLEGAAEETEVSGRLRSLLLTPDQLTRVLAGEDVDEGGLRVLVNRIGPAAVDPLYEALRRSESRAIRRKVFDVLSRMGDDVVGRAIRSLGDDRWFVKRNMLALVQRMETLPEGFSAMEHTQHEDARVRREAFPLAFRIPGERQRALAAALSDPDERVVRMALLEVQTEIPETLVPVVVNRILRDNPFPALRGLATRALRNAASPLAREALLQISSGGRTLLGRTRVANGSPEVLAALSALAANWAGHEHVDALLTAARGSRDPRIRNAAEAPHGAEETIQ